jgi:hypothetical protein
MNKNRLPPAVILLLFAATIPLLAHAHSQTDEASRTLENCLQALGGIERLRALNSLYFKGDHRHPSKLLTKN